MHYTSKLLYKTFGFSTSGMILWYVH